MVDSITLEHAKAVVSHLSQLTENQYSSIVAAANDTEKEKLKKTAIGPRMADLKPDQVTLVGADDNKITQQELVDTFNEQLTKDGGAGLTEEQNNYLWDKSIVVIKDPGGSANPANSPTTVPDAPPAAPPPPTTTRPESVAPTPLAMPKPPEDTVAPTSFNKPVTKLNLDADDTKPSDGEKNLEKLVNLRYGLDLLESKGDVHVALGGVEESYVNAALESLKQSPAPDSRIDNGSSDEYKDGETPTSPQGFVLKQAIEEYKKINKPLAAIAEAARDKKINEMTEVEQKALIEVFENYQKKFTKLKGEVSEEKLKQYLTDNYDTLKDLGIYDFPDNREAINGKKKEELITLSVAARNKLNEKISEEFENITISPDDKKAFLKKYTDIDFSDSGKSIEFIKSLSDEELLILNRYSADTNHFISRDFIIRELSQHKLGLEDTLGLNPVRLFRYSDLVSYEDSENLLKKYDPKNTDLSKNKEFIQGLTPEELVIFSNNSNKGFSTKKSILSELDKAGNKGKSLKDIFGVTEYELGSDYLDILKTKEPGEILAKLKDPAMQEILKNTPLKTIGGLPAHKYTRSDGKTGKLYILNDAYLVDFNDAKAPKFYKSEKELLGLPAQILDGAEYKFSWLANEHRDIIGYDTQSQSIHPTSLLRLSENAGRLKTPHVTVDGSNEINTLYTILEKIYASEEEALKTKEETTKWHQEMKRRVAKLLMSSSDDEFVTNRQEFQKYLNDTYSGINGWNIVHIDGLRKAFNSADAQTETMLREVQLLLATSHDTKAKPASP